MTHVHMAQIAVLAFLAAVQATPSAAQSAAPKIRVDQAAAEDARASGTVMAETAKTVANGLVFTGNLSFNRVGSSVTLSAEGIYNNSSTRNSGTLRLELWATTTQPGRAAGFTGYRLAVGPTLSRLTTQTHYSNVVQTTTFLEPPSGTYWIVMVLGEFDSANCFGNDSYCNQDSLVFSNQQTFGTTIITPPRLGGIANSLASRGTVTSSATLYGAFELGARSTVYLLVRGNSLGSLGVTQGYLDAPRVRLYNAQGVDIVTQGGMPGFNDCLAANTTDSAVVSYYSQIRAAPVHARDSCYSASLGAGAYTFSVTPSVSGVTSSSTTSSPPSGEVLFEVTLVN
jgi:hypothetical protein